VHRIVFILVAASLGACVAVSPLKSAAEKRAEQTALERAYRIVAKRGWPLPAGYRAHVAVFHSMSDERFDMYWVVFDQPRPHKSPIPLYRVTFLRTTGEFTGAFDDRGQVREEEIEVAERAFKRRFPDEHHTTIAGAEGRIVRVTFLADKKPYHPDYSPHTHTVVAIVDRATLTVKSLRESNE
jgi:hypothetical protein